MNISAKTEYACVAMLELALRHAAREPVQIRKIAQAHGIPSRFLVQILLQLKNAGLVASTRGAAGGYQLARDPKRITLGDVMHTVDGHAERADSPALPPSAATAALADAWNAAARAEARVLESISFGDLVDRVREKIDHEYSI